MAAFPKLVKEEAEPRVAASVRESDIEYLLAALALVPLLMGLLVAKYVTPVYTIRNTLVCLPAAYVLVAHGGLKLKRPLGILALLSLLVFGLSSHPLKYPHSYKGDWSQAADLVAAQPEAGVLAQNSSVAFNLETYPRLHGRTSSPNIAFAIDLEAKPAKGGRTSLGKMRIPTFLSRFDKVYVVAGTRADPIFTYMQAQPGWRLVETVDMFKPTVRLYTRVN
jgi:hypothetical protein